MMDERYKKLSIIPESALKPIGFGKLKGKTDVNPQTKIEMMTDVYGLCGIGWRFEIVSKETMPFDDGQIGLFMVVALYFTDDIGWSQPIYGYGGDFIRKKTKDGLVINEDAFKGCLTDALGNAMKYIGMAAEVYKGNFDGSKYINQEGDEKTTEKSQNKPKQAEKSKEDVKNDTEYVKIIKEVCHVLTQKGLVPIDTLDSERLTMLLNIEEYFMAKPYIEMLLNKRKSEETNEQVD